MNNEYMVETPARGFSFPPKNQREKFPPGFVPEQNLSFSLAKNQNDRISFCF
jgi:hypothetical protein